MTAESVHRATIQFAFRLSFLFLLICFSKAVMGQVPVTQIRYLSGTGKDDTVQWDFYCTAGRKSGVWTRIGVPSCWEQQGFGAYNYGRDKATETNPIPNEQGKYRVNFRVPISWKGKTVRLVFEGSMTDTEVWVNGQSAGPIHQGSFYRFKYDITPLLKFGQANLLEVTVSKVSANQSVNRAERTNVDYWVFGGIFRPVYLEALPQQFIDWTAIDARADGTLNVAAYLNGKSQDADKISAQMLDSRGVAIGSSFSADLSEGQQSLNLHSKVASPKLWTAETPNLYRVRLTLLGQGKPIHSLTERFGFRTFEVRAGDGLYLNGRKITLRGVNRHSFWPESGRTLSREISYNDVKLIKELNANAVRMSHYPPDTHFLEACDELGLYVLDELGGWHGSYDTPTGRKLISEMVRRDVNHPSIIFWDNGNEGGWNRENDGEFAKWDPQQRTVLHPWELMNHVNTAHYRRYPEAEKILSGSDIYMPTEFLHGLYDGGAGAGLWDYWELMRKSKLGAGGFIWALLDECVARTDQNGKLDCAGNQGPDGIVGPHREKEGSFNTISEIWSPVQVTKWLDLPGVEKTYFGVEVENRYDFTNLNECKFQWELAVFPSPDKGRGASRTIGSGAFRGPNVGPHDSYFLPLDLPYALRRADVIYLSVLDPNGRVLWTWSWAVRRKAIPPPAIDGKPVQARDEGGRLVVSVGPFEFRFNKKTGALTDIIRNRRVIHFGNGPRLVAFRREDRKYRDISGLVALAGFDWRKDGADVVVDAQYRGALSKVIWRVSPDGSLRLEYEYKLDGPIDLAGVNFDFPEAEMKSIRWLGMGPYRVWQNRLLGTRLDVWENKYNDSTPGESWIYPEFKGYFCDWRWATLTTTSGKITISSQAGDQYLGIYKPRDGKDGLLDLPELGIAVLDVIPAMRNKFHTTDEIGPQSKPKESIGRRGTIYFRFD